MRLILEILRYIPSVNVCHHCFYLPFLWSFLCLEIIKLCMHLLYFLNTQRTQVFGVYIFFSRWNTSFQMRIFICFFLFFSRTDEPCYKVRAINIPFCFVLLCFPGVYTNLLWHSDVILIRQITACCIKPLHEPILDPQEHKREILNQNTSIYVSHCVRASTINSSLWIQEICPISFRVTSLEHHEVIRNCWHLLSNAFFGYSIHSQ